MKGRGHCDAFLNNKEEAELFAHAVDNEYECWGIDQEFIGAPRLILRALVQRAKTKQARELAATALKQAWDGFKHYAQTGSRDKAFMSLASAELWNELQAAFPFGSAEYEMIEHLRVSQHIYRLHLRGEHYKNNSQRISFMKRIFSDQLQSSPDSRVLIKLGSAHAGRGYSPFDQLDVGNHAAEMAIARGGKSLHLLVLAKKSYDAEGNATDQTTAESPLHHFVQPDDNSEAKLIHLTKLRPILAISNAKTAHPDLHDIVFRYDFLLTLPEFHPSESLVPMP